MTSLSIHRQIGGWVLMETEPSHLAAWYSTVTRSVCIVDLSDIDSRPDPITRIWERIQIKRAMQRNVFPGPGYRTVAITNGGVK